MKENILPTQSASPPRSLLGIVGGTAAVVALAFGLAVGPQHQVVGSQRAGDVGLASQVHEALEGVGGFRSLLVADVTVDGSSWAGVGNGSAARDGEAPEQNTLFELGSITKTFTGSLFADAIERGEVAAKDSLAQHLPELDGTAAGEVTLQSLAQHSSGLPGLGATAMSEALTSVLLNKNPYASTNTQQLLADAATTPVNADQPPTYSNFGVSLLGTAVARAANAPSYSALLQERITEPLGMSSTTLAADAADVPANAAPGFQVNGTRAPRWYGEGYLPAGTGTFTTIADLTRWAQAQLDGSAPGLSALEPTANFGAGTHIGYLWLTSDTSEVSKGDGPSAMTWHNGMTAGFTSMLALDRDSGHAVVVLGNSAAGMDSVATALLYGTEVSGQPDTVVIAEWMAFGLAALLSLLALWRAIRGRSTLHQIGALLGSAAGLMLLWSSGPWTTAGGGAYGLALVPALVGATIMALRARTLPFQPRKHAWVSWIGAALGALSVICMSVLN